MAKRPMGSLMRASWFACLLVLAITSVVPAAAAQGLDDCTGNPIGEGIYVSGCRAYVTSQALDLVGWAEGRVTIVVGAALCLFNTAPAQWASCIPPT